MNEEHSIKPGVYRAKAIRGSAQFGRSSNGNEQVALRLLVAELNRELTTIISFSDKSRQYSLERLKACGWQGGTDPSLPGIDRNEVSVEVKYEFHNGKQQMRVDILTGIFSFKEPMNEREIKGFLASLGRPSGGNGGGYGGRGLPQPPPGHPAFDDFDVDAPPPRRDPDIPF